MNERPEAAAWYGIWLELHSGKRLISKIRSRAIEWRVTSSLFCVFWTKTNIPLVWNRIKNDVPCFLFLFPAWSWEFAFESSVNIIQYIENIFKEINLHNRTIALKKLMGTKQNQLENYLMRDIRMNRIHVDQLINRNKYIWLHRNTCTWQYYRENADAGRKLLIESFGGIRKCRQNVFWKMSSMWRCRFPNWIKKNAFLGWNPIHTLVKVDLKNANS